MRREAWADHPRAFADAGDGNPFTPKSKSRGGGLAAQVGC